MKTIKVENEINTDIKQNVGFVLMEIDDSEISKINNLILIK